jgi:hypothetical protein
MPSAGIGSITLLQGVDSEDEEELEEPETFRASAARIEKPQKKDEKWKDPTKIMKRPEPQEEKKLAVPKAMRSGEWKPAIVTEHIEVEKKRTPIALMIVHVDGTPRYPSTIYRLYSYHHNTELKQHYTIPPQQ